ncbi:hypothetical protein J6590_029155 [Homalodisca vitripennis]|nr:hypothetical protein J6590_029155 [Homalodisca vitripennis]
MSAEQLLYRAIHPSPAIVRSVDSEPNLQRAYCVGPPPTPNWDFSAKSESDSFRERRILDLPPSGEVCAQSVKWEELSGESAQARGNHRGSPNHSVPVHELLMQRHNEVIATGGENEW